MGLRHRRVRRRIRRHAVNYERLFVVLVLGMAVIAFALAAVIVTIIGEL